MISVRHYTGDKFYQRNDLDYFTKLTNGESGTMLKCLRIKDIRDHVFVMRENRKIIGWCLASRTWAGLDEIDDGYYLSFFIDENHRGRGLSKRFPIKLRDKLNAKKVFGFYFKSVRKIMNRKFIDSVNVCNQNEDDDFDWWSGCWDEYHFKSKLMDHNND